MVVLKNLKVTWAIIIKEELSAGNFEKKVINM